MTDRGEPRSTAGAVGARVYVDGAPVAVRPWSTWRDAVTARDPSLARALGRGEAWIADARGEPLDEGGAAVPGARVRLVRVGGTELAWDAIP